MKTIITLLLSFGFGLEMMAQVSFTLSSSPSAGSQPQAVIATDVNGDGKADLVVANTGANALLVLTNNGSGGFVLAASPSVGNNPVLLAAADVNGDGKVDLISANYYGNSLSVLTNNGSGVFVPASTLGVGVNPISVAAADVNGDGKADLISLDSGNFDNTVSVLTNNGSGGFVTAGKYGVGYGSWSLSAADVNGDDKLDLITANGGDATLSVLTNSGSGGFVTAKTYAVGSHPESVATADINGDGKVDLISANSGDNALSVLTNSGSGGFVIAGTYFVGSSPIFATTADINGDGKLDLICANFGDTTLSVLTNNGSGGFASTVNFTVGSSPRAVVAADINGDGKLDLICVNYGSSTVSILTNGTPFPPASLPAITTQPADQTNLVGTVASFSVGAMSVTGLQLFSYQWRLAGTNLPAATNNPLVLQNLALSQAGNYDVVVANSAGSVTSSPAILDVRFIFVKVNGQLATGTVTAIAPATAILSGGYPSGFLFYTLDGSTPTTSSTFYSGPIILTDSVVMRTLSLSADFSQTSEGAPVTIQIILTYNLQTSVIGGGTLGTNPPSGPYISNSVVTLTANAASHWAFDHWTGDATGSQNPLSVTMNGPRSVQAVFVQVAFPLTLTTPGGGNMKANGLVIAPATYYPTGSVVSITATASNGWSFLGWQGNASGTNNPLSLTINQTNIIQAIFGTVVATNSIGGGVVLGQPNPIPYGTILTVSAVPDPGNYFVMWSGSVSGTNAPTRITVTNANPNISALFTPLPGGKYTLSVVVNGNGFVTNNPQRNYYSPGDSVTLKATNNAGAFFFGWTQDAAGTNNPLTILMTTNKIVHANFGVLPTVSVSPLNLTVLAGNIAGLSASALGLPPLAYQWQNSLGAIAGATNAFFIFSNTQPTNAGIYFVVVTNSSGSVTSAVATMAVIGLPAITNQPPALTTVTSGHAASFAVGAYGWPALTYQWQFNGINLNGATNTALTLQNAFPANTGIYTVIITNVYASVTSNPAMLTVLPMGITAPTRLANGQFQFSFDTAAGVNYSVEYSTNLTDWYPLFTVGGIGQPLTLSDPNMAGNQQRYYRISMLPK